jgi:hypothetical protein
MNINRVLLCCVLLSATTLNGRADDPFHNIYHSLKRFFTGDDKHSSGAPQHKHSPLKHAHAQSSPGEPQGGNTPEPRTVVLPEATPVQGDHAAKAEDSKAADTKSTDTKASDTKASDTKASDTKASDTKPTDTKPAEVVVPSLKSPEPPPTGNPTSVLRSVP